jgi:hypothetical protein
MESVCLFHFHPTPSDEILILDIVASSGKSILWFVDLQRFSSNRPGLLIFFICSTIIEEIKTLSEAGKPSMTYFYSDFRNASKQGLKACMVPSLLNFLLAQARAATFDPNFIRITIAERSNPVTVI